MFPEAAEAESLRDRKRSIKKREYTKREQITVATQKKSS
jgi:hypothetical protein